MERSIELRPSSFNTKYLAYGYAYLTYKYGMSTEKLESLWISEKSKSQHNDEMALQTISALLAYSYAKKKENKLPMKQDTKNPVLYSPNTFVSKVKKETK